MVWGKWLFFILFLLTRAIVAVLPRGTGQLGQRMRGSTQNQRSV